jgi:septation ring formation regulator EzrA
MENWAILSVIFGIVQTVIFALVGVIWKMLTNSIDKIDKSISNIKMDLKMNDTNCISRLDNYKREASVTHSDIFSRLNNQFVQKDTWTDHQKRTEKDIEKLECGLNDIKNAMAEHKVMIARITEELSGMNKRLEKILNSKYKD